MNLKDIGEFGFINRISRGCIVREKGVIKGIGDDCAVYSTGSGQVNLVTTDLLIESVHFLRDATSGFNLGFKALAVNFSDIAAMGGAASDAFISIGIPQDCSLEFLEDIYAGMKILASRYNVNLLGGDTTSSKNDLVLSITVTGKAEKDKILYRDGAKPGDIIFTTGSLGDSRAGLHIIKNNIESELPEFTFLKNAHLLPVVYLNEGRFFADTGHVTSMIDISDGLSSDLSHIVKASGTGARIYADKLPISPALKKFSSLYSFNSTDYALMGGEDYTLLFTVSPEQTREVTEAFGEGFHKEIYPIGDITDSGKIELVSGSGKTSELKPSGWDHFKYI